MFGCESFRLATIEVSALFQHHGILRPGVSQRYHEFHYVLGECIQELDQRDYPFSVHSHCKGITLRCANGNSQNCDIDINLRDVYMSWPAHVVVLDKGLLQFFRASSLLSKLKAFSASISSMLSVSGFSKSFLKLWIAYSIPHFWPKQSWKFFPTFLRSAFIHWVIVLPIIRLRTSPIPMILTPEFLSGGIRMSWRLFVRI